MRLFIDPTACVICLVFQLQFNVNCLCNVRIRTPLLLLKCGNNADSLLRKGDNVNFFLQKRKVILTLNKYETSQRSFAKENLQIDRENAFLFFKIEFFKFNLTNIFAVCFTE